MKQSKDGKESRVKRVLRPRTRTSVEFMTDVNQKELEIKEKGLGYLCLGPNEPDALAQGARANIEKRKPIAANTSQGTIDRLIAAQMDTDKPALVLLLCKDLQGREKTQVQMAGTTSTFAAWQTYKKLHGALDMGKVPTLKIEFENIKFKNYGYKDVRAYFGDKLEAHAVYKLAGGTEISDIGMLTDMVSKLGHAFEFERKDTMRKLRAMSAHAAGGGGPAPEQLDYQKVWDTFAEAEDDKRRGVSSDEESASDDSDEDDFETPTKPSVAVTTTAAVPDDVDRIAAIVGKVLATTGLLGGAATRNGGGRGGRAARGGGGGAGGKRKRSCFCCGAEDHIARSCPKGHKASQE